jgi:SAM-dependent methyltransferase
MRVRTGRRPCDDRAVTSQLWGSDRAANYDGDTGMWAPEAVDPAVDFLVALARPNGTALEFAIGTGRIGLPLSERGVSVTGIDTSTAMLDILRAKPGADRLRIVVGDMSADTVDGEFDVVYLVFNTISNLLTQDAQVACFRNAARHLRPGGRFVTELNVPSLRMLPPGAVAVPFTIEDDYAGFDTYDLLTQRSTSHHYHVRDGAARVIHSEHRYIWPSELDLMAQLAGMHLVERWSAWDRSEFTAESRSAISVWAKP